MTRHRFISVILSLAALTAGLALGACAGPSSAPPAAPAPEATAAAEGAAPSPRDIPAPEPADVDLAGAPCQGVARYLSVRSAVEPELSPDGSRLGFLTQITGLPQLWSVPVPAPADSAGRSGPDGAWPEQLTFGNRVQFAAWRPTGDWIAYGTDRGGNERTQFFLLASDGTRERALTPADQYFRTFGGWSPAGDRIAYSSNQRNGRDFDIYLLDIAPDGTPRGEPRMVLQGAGNMNIAAWRPDGEALVLARGRGEADNDLFLLDLESRALEPLFQPDRPDQPKATSRYTSIQWLPDGSGFFLATNHQRDVAGLARYDLATGTLHWLHTPKWNVQSVALSADGRYLAWTVNENGFSRLHLVDREVDREDRGETENDPGRALPAPAIPAGVIRSIEWARGAPRLAIAVSGPDLPGDVWVYDAPANALVRATHSSLAGLAPERFVAPEPVSFPSLDGVEIHGFLYKPRMTGETRPPVVMMLHGGPTSQARPTFDPVLQYLVGRGYAVLDLDYRGSTGYGQRFTQLDNKRLRPHVVHDLEAAVQWLRDRADVDGERVAAMGGSYGGYLVLAAVAMLPEHFDAGVDIVGVANWITALEDASPSLKNSDRVEYGNIDDPEDREFFRSISPITYADRIRSPLLVVHGANDPRVPVAEADQIVSAVRGRGGEVEYLRFPDEGHGVTRLQNRITAYQRIARFLDRTIGAPGMPCANQ